MLTATIPSVLPNEVDEDDDVRYGYRGDDPDDDDLYVEEARPSVDVDVEVGSRF